MVQPDNNILFHKLKYYCMADLQFDWLRFICFRCVELDRHFQVWSNPNQSNRSSAIQWFIPLQSKWEFSGWAFIPKNLYGSYLRLASELGWWVAWLPHKREVCGFECHKLLFFIIVFFAPYLKRDLSEPLFALYFKTLAKTLFKFLLEKKIKYFDAQSMYVRLQLFDLCNRDGQF